MWFSGCALQAHINATDDFWNNWQQSCFKHWTVVGLLDINQEHEIKGMWNLTMNVILASKKPKEKTAAGQEGRKWLP